MKKLFIVITTICSLTTFSCTRAQEKPVNAIAEQVNTLLGNTADINLFSGAVAPFGMAHLSPFYNTKQPIDSSNQRIIYGFNIIKYGKSAICIMPCTGQIFTDTSKIKSTCTNELGTAGFLRTYLFDYEINTESSASQHAIIQQYTFPSKDGDANIVFSLTSEQADGAYVKPVSKNEIEGYTSNNGFYEQSNLKRIYFVAQFSKDADKVNVDTDKPATKITSSLQFTTSNNEKIVLKIGVSFVSVDNARKNLNAEIPDFNFNAIKDSTCKQWNQELSKILIKDSVDVAKNKTLFYTALYRVLIQSPLISDVNGEFPSLINTKSLKAETHKQFAVCNLWHTYNNVYVLYELFYPQHQQDVLKSIASMAKETGDISSWLNSSTTRPLAGDPYAPIIADSYIKGFKGFDANIVLKALVNTASKANNVRPLNAEYISKGMISLGDKKDKYKAISEALAYNYSDWALSKFAKELKNKAVYYKFADKPRTYRAYFNKTTGYVGSLNDNTWRATFKITHDVNGLITIMGHYLDHTNKTQGFFNNKNFNINDKSELSFPYLFTYTDGESWHTQQQVRSILQKYFLQNHCIPANDGDACYSAWFVMSAMGIYATCPGNTDYSLGSPIFDTISISLDSTFYSGKTFNIITENNSPNNYFVTEAQLNGYGVGNFFIEHADIVNGGEIKFIMAGKKP